ncbi:cytochrome c oxidase subunit 2 [Varanus komodoensis]|nr:cytochrome c oxidase subunit 2 [Varanus komodoensis]
MSFDSYIIPTEDLPNGFFRLLDVNYRIVVPTESPIRILITAEDELKLMPYQDDSIKQLSPLPDQAYSTGSAQKFVDPTTVLYPLHPELLGIPLIVFAISLPVTLTLTSNAQLTNNRPTILQS